MNCDQAKTEMVAYLRDEMNSGQKRHLEDHLARCPACRRELEGARRLLEWTEAASDEAVVKKVEGIINNAIKAGASDIHLEPARDALSVRYRMDGVLQDVERIDPVLRYSLIARVKMIAEMNVAEDKLPQHGRFRWEIGGKQFDIRASSAPLIYGESIVLRLLDRSVSPISIEKIGMSEEDLQKLERLVHQPCGMLFITGPTGSGKTTVLYSLVRALQRPELKILMVEDPVEYPLPGVNQLQVNRKIGLTFPTALRAFLRQDPDVIAVGECRDLETAELCAEAAITGHMVLSHLHTDDAVGAIQRLRDMGVKDFLIGAGLVGATAQRLVRKVCQNCKEEVGIDLDDPIIRSLGITAEDLRGRKVYRGRGCEACRSTGYKGRLAIFEVLEIDRELSKLIGSGATPSEILGAARQKGHRTLYDDGKQKVLEGITTPEEVFRVLA